MSETCHKQIRIAYRDFASGRGGSTERRRSCAFPAVWMLSALILGFGSSGRAASSAIEANPAGPDAILFDNRDLLFGELQSIDPKENLVWRHPDAMAPIKFRIDNVTELRLWEKGERANGVADDCIVRLTNEDELFGRLVAVDPESVVLDTWYAGQLRIRRRMVQVVIPKPAPPPPLFTGPTGEVGWTFGDIQNEAVVKAGHWRYRDGALYATLAASVARDVNLPDTASLEFDLEWKGTFDLAVALYTDTLQPIGLASKETGPDFGGFYSLRLSAAYANLMPVTKLDPLRYLGQVALQPYLQGKAGAHFEVRMDKAKNLVALLVDGSLAKVWNDNPLPGASPNQSQRIGDGTAIRIVHQGQGASKISNLAVREWDGQFDEPVSNSPNSPSDLVKLRNGDKMTGDAKSVRDGKVFVSMGERSMEVPLGRVKQIEMAGAQAERPEVAPLAVRAQFARGGIITFQLEKYDEQGFAASTPAFGKAVFDRAAFTRIEFNPDQTLRAVPQTAANRAEGPRPEMFSPANAQLQAELEALLHAKGLQPAKIKDWLRRVKGLKPTEIEGLLRNAEQRP